MRQFDVDLRNLIQVNAPKPIAHCGDIVWANWGWKKPHKVLIYRVEAELVSINLTVGEMQRNYPDGNYPVMGVDLYYCAYRLDKDGKSKDRKGCGVILHSLETLSGEKWERNKQHTGYNHRGLTATLEEEN